MSNLKVAPQTVLNELGIALANAVQHLKALNQSVEVRPAIRQQIGLSEVDGTVYRFRLNPTVFRVLERPDKNQPHLFIVVRGDVHLDLAEPARRVTFFGTEVGYFLHAPGSGELEGKFAAHYDFHEAINHPIFHAQLTGIDDQSRQLILDQFPIEVTNYTDHTQGLFRQVRIPTAQMDFLAVLAQIGADHLLHQDAGPSQIQAFASLRESCSEVPVALGGLGRFDTDHADNCVRAPHWYPPD